jgi:hypothetical protein
MLTLFKTHPKLLLLQYTIIANLHQIGGKCSMCYKIVSNFPIKIRKTPCNLKQFVLYLTYGASFTLS